MSLLNTGSWFILKTQTQIAKYFNILLLLGKDSFFTYKYYNVVGNMINITGGDLNWKLSKNMLST